MESRYEIRLTARCQKGMKKLSRPDFEKCFQKMKILEEFDAKTSNIKKMYGVGAKAYRLRVGNMRVVFEVVGRVIWILDIGYRGGVYDDM